MLFPLFLRNTFGECHVTNYIAFSWFHEYNLHFADFNWWNKLDLGEYYNSWNKLLSGVISDNYVVLVMLCVAIHTDIDFVVQFIVFLQHINCFVYWNSLMKLLPQHSSVYFYVRDMEFTLLLVTSTGDPDLHFITQIIRNTIHLIISYGSKT